jgi:hypothetical protein
MMMKVMAMNLEDLKADLMKALGPEAQDLRKNQNQKRGSW